MVPSRLTLHEKVDSMEEASLSPGVQNVKNEEDEKTVATQPSDFDEPTPLSRLVHGPGWDRKHQRIFEMKLLVFPHSHFCKKAPLARIP